MARTELASSRRQVLRLMACAGFALPLAACGEDDWYGMDVTGTLPDLGFTMRRVSDGGEVSARDYRDQTVALFFGYTFCPDICPMTLANLTDVAERLGDRAGGLTILFVTVDPDRDTPDVMEAYVSSFTDRASGLRGTANQLARLARALRVTYKVADHAPGAPSYEVSHGKSVYIFDGKGEARLIWPEFDTLQADTEAATGDLRRLIA